ncbi:MAG: L-lactate permease [Bacteroidota bacterium]
MLDHFSLLSFLPIILLLVLSIWKGVRTGIFVGFAVTVVLFFFSGSDLLTFFASLISAFAGTINILMIIFGAVFLYHIMDQKGFISGIKESLTGIHPDKNFRFFFLALFLTAFFESVAGFGTPGAIVPLILISIGFPPVLSIAVVLLVDGFFAVSGAVGTPVIAGLEIPLNLTQHQVGIIYQYASIAIFLSGIVVTLFIYRYLNKEMESKPGKAGWILYMAIMLPYMLGAYFLKELSGIIASIIMALFSYFFLFKNKAFPWKPWLPYLLLVFLLLLPKIFPWLASVLAYKLDFPSIYGTRVSTSLQPFRSPLIPFLISAIFALYKVRDFTINLKPVISKTFAVFLILFPSLAITQLMMNSGDGTFSMIDALATVFVKTGNAYPLVSPLIGIIGAFITGSTTVSNIIFGSLQYNAAIDLEVQPAIILGLQLAGASLGNAICLFNIIAAGAVAGVSRFNQVLKKNLLPVFFTSLVCTIVGYLLITIF